MPGPGWLTYLPGDLASKLVSCVTCHLYDYYQRDAEESGRFCLFSLGFRVFGFDVSRESGPWQASKRVRSALSLSASPNFGALMVLLGAVFAVETSDNESVRTQCLCSSPSPTSTHTQRSNSHVSPGILQTYVPVPRQSKLMVGKSLHSLNDLKDRKEMSGGILGWSHQQKRNEERNDAP